MARDYRVLEKSFINNRLVEPGARVSYAGKAGKNLELIDDNLDGDGDGDGKPGGSLPKAKRKAEGNAELA